MRILVTGCAGFIGFHTCKKLLENKYNVYGIDNLNKNYDINLKKSRLKKLNSLAKSNQFIFNKIDISNNKKLSENFNKFKYDIVINLAAQAGVRNSIYDSSSYFKNNLIGFYNILENSKNIKVKHLIYASTSSVYGNSTKYPSVEDDNTDKPLSFYAATKKSNEILAYSYSAIFNLKTTGLRFFTVYGPYGRPDMALYKFVSKILNNKKIEVYNKGNHYRDFTYIDDVSNAIIKLLFKPSKKNTSYQIFNIANGNSVKLKEYIKLIEKELKINSKKKYLKLQRGDVYKTSGSTNKIEKYISYNPKINVKEGLKEFITWYKEFYK